MGWRRTRSRAREGDLEGSMLPLRVWFNNALAARTTAAGVAPGQYQPSSQQDATKLAREAVNEAVKAIQSASAVPLVLWATQATGSGGVIMQPAGGAPAPPTSPWASQLLVDFCFNTGYPPLGIAFTAESEMFLRHDVDLLGNFAWDFIKLMIVPRPIRLFLCRVAGRRGDPGSQRRARLRALLGDLARAYDADGLLRQADELGLVILPAETWSTST